MSFSAKADMNEVCNVVLKDQFLQNGEIHDQIKKCERGNILYVWFDTEYFDSQDGIVKYEWDTDTDYTQIITVRYCRYDRNVTKEGRMFSCVLNSNAPRRFKFN